MFFVFACNDSVELVLFSSCLMSRSNRIQKKACNRSWLVDIQVTAK